jgi:hypothetical protein
MDTGIIIAILGLIGLLFGWVLKVLSEIKSRNAEITNIYAEKIDLLEKRNEDLQNQLDQAKSESSSIVIKELEGMLLTHERIIERQKKEREELVQIVQSFLSPVPALDLILSQVQELEEKYRNEPENTGVQFSLGKRLFFLGDAKSALDHFIDVVNKKSDPRGIRKGWVIAASLTLGDVKIARQVLDEGDFDYVDWDYYELIYNSWCSALNGSKNAWDVLINRCLKDKKFPSLDIHSPHFVYFELAAGLAATGQLENAWQAISLSEVYNLPPIDGQLYMCGLVTMSSFDRLHRNKRYEEIFEDWFNGNINHLRLYPLKELRAKIVDWHNTRGS